jgi:hypothetical protein
MYATDQGPSNDDADYLASVDPVENHAMGAQVDSLALRPIRESSETPYYAPLRAVILVV